MFDRSRLAMAAAAMSAATLGTADAFAQLPAGFVDEVVVTHPGINWNAQNMPTSVAFTPDGTTLYFALKSGLQGASAEIWRVDMAALPLPGDLGTAPGPTAPFATLPVFTSGTGDNQGLLGIAVDPNYATNGHVYAFYDPVIGGGLVASIVRFTAVGGTGTAMTRLIGGIPQSFKHNGGKLLFGPDGFLYFSVGDTEDPSLATDPASMAAKIHRVDPATGLAAPGNPSGGTAWAAGLRNVFGMAFSPLSPGVLWVTDPMGPCRDELNRVTAGCWYGWAQALAVCSAGDPNFPNPVTPNPCGATPFVPPACLFAPTTLPVTPCGIGFNTRSAWPAEYAGDLFTTEFSGGRIRRFELTGTPTNPSPDAAIVDCPMSGASVFFDTGTASVDLEFGPDGHLYYTTNSGIRRIRYTGALPNLALALQGIPGLGRSVAIHAVHGDAGWFGAVVPGTALLPSPIPTPWGSVSIAFFTPFIAFPLPGGPFGASGMRSLVVPIPNDASLVGGNVWFQGFEFAPSLAQGNASAPFSVTIVP